MKPNFDPQSENPEPIDFAEAAADAWEKLGPAPQVNYAFLGNGLLDGR